MTLGSGLFSNQKAVHPSYAAAGKGGLPGEVGDLRRDVSRVLAELSAIAVEKFSAPPAESTTAIMAKADVDIASDGLELSVSNFTLHQFSPPRQIVLTTISSANWITSKYITLTGTNARNEIITEAIKIASASTLTSTKFFKTLTGISIPAQTAAIANSIDIGISANLGLSAVLNTTLSGPALLAEYIGNTRVDGSKAVYSDQFGATDPVAADADEFFTAAVGVLATSAVPLDPSDFNGDNTTGVLTEPRNVTFTASGTSTGSAVVIGTDVYGNPMTESIAISGGAGLKTGTKTFKTITEVTLPAQAAAGETVTMGVGTVIGLTRKAAIPAGGSIPIMIQELADGSAPTAGALTAPSTNAPNGGYAANGNPTGSASYTVVYAGNCQGTLVPPADSGEQFGYYTPSLAADGLRSYSLYYEYDPAA